MLCLTAFFCEDLASKCLAKPVTGFEPATY
jgi:hypothetical protein